MSVANSMIIASRCSAFSNGCRVASFEGCVTTSTQRKSRYPTSPPSRWHHVSVSYSDKHKLRNGVIAAAGACVMCNSLRLTAACSASSGLNSTLHRHGNTLMKHHSTAATTRNHNVTSLVANEKYRQNHLLQGDHVLPGISPGAGCIKSSNVAAFNPYAFSKISIHTSSKVNDSTAVFISDALSGLTGQTINCSANFGDGINETGWRMSELIGAICLASTVTAGSLFLGPFGNIIAGNEDTKGEGTGGSKRPGDRGSGNKKIGGTGAGGDQQYESDTNEPEVTVGIASISPAYEVGPFIFSVLP